MGTTSCSIHRTTCFHTPSYFGFLQVYGYSYPQRNAHFILDNPASSPRQNASNSEHASIPLVLSAGTHLSDHICAGRLTAWLPDYMLKAMYKTSTCIILPIFSRCTLYKSKAVASYITSSERPHRYHHHSRISLNFSWVLGYG